MWGVNRGARAPRIVPIGVSHPAAVGPLGTGRLVKRGAGLRADQDELVDADFRGTQREHATMSPCVPTPQTGTRGRARRLASFLVPEYSSGGIGVHKRSATGRTASGVRYRIRQLFALPEPQDWIRTVF